jgi:hypothetical protein
VRASASFGPVAAGRGVDYNAPSRDPISVQQSLADMLRQ